MDTVDLPVFQFSNTARQNGARVRDLAITHEGGTTAAIRFSNVIRWLVEDCHVEGNSSGARGLETANDAFFGRAERSDFLSVIDAGIDIRGAGFAHVVEECHCNTGSVGTRVGVANATIIGGEHQASSGTGVKFDNQTGSRNTGGYVRTTTENTSIDADITGSSS